MAGLACWRGSVSLAAAVATDGTVAPAAAVLLLLLLVVVVVVECPRGWWLLLDVDVGWGVCGGDVKKGVMELKMGWSWAIVVNIFMIGSAAARQDQTPSYEELGEMKKYCIF